MYPNPQFTTPHVSPEQCTYQDQDIPISKRIHSSQHGSILGYYAFHKLDAHLILTADSEACNIIPHIQMR